MTKGSKFDDFLKDENIEIDEEKIKENIEQMTDKEIINSTNSQKISAYCKTCVCKSCEQVAWLEPENIELKVLISQRDASVTAQAEIILKLKAENEQLKAECNMYKTFYRAKHDDIKGILFKYRQTLQDIKAIANSRFVSGLNEEADAYNMDMQRIIDLITKAESEG